jgi:hypothetical protein
VTDANSKALSEGLRDLGWIEGQNFVWERRFSEARNERFPSLAAELVQTNPDVIISPGTAATVAASVASTSPPLRVDDRMHAELHLWGTASACRVIGPATHTHTSAALTVTNQVHRRRLLMGDGADFGDDRDSVRPVRRQCPTMHPRGGNTSCA